MACLRFSVISIAVSLYLCMVYARAIETDGKYFFLDKKDMFPSKHQFFHMMSDFSNRSNFIPFVFPNDRFM